MRSASSSSLLAKPDSPAASVRRASGADIVRGTPTKNATNAAAASFATLVTQIGYLSSADIEQVRRAYKFSDEAHLGQLRQNGEPYITHPIAVAAQCTEWKLDAQALMAALLHDIMEDCGVTKAELLQNFGASVAELVDGLTKLERLEFNTREEAGRSHAQHANLV